MASNPETESRAEEYPESNGVTASLLVGWIMVGVYLLSAVLGVYERELLNSLYPYSAQFAFLRSLFPSPLATDVIDWQNVLLLQVAPFLLFFYFAVRMRLSPLGRVLPTVIAIGVVGACLSFLNSFLVAYQPIISSVLLPGSPATQYFQAEPLGAVLSSILSPIGLWFVLEHSMVFAALGMTGIAFGSFSGETPTWIVRSWLASQDRGQGEGVPTSEDAPGAKDPEPSDPEPSA